LNTNFLYEDTIKQEVDDKEANKNRKKIVNFTGDTGNNSWNSLSPFNTKKNYEQQST